MSPSTRAYYIIGPRVSTYFGIHSSLDFPAVTITLRRDIQSSHVRMPPKKINAQKKASDSPVDKAVKVKECAPGTLQCSTHIFNCGEQWLMACKAWLFEDKNLPAILQTASPREQKSLGRSVKSFNDELWTVVSPEVCIAGALARAKVDRGLAEIYRQSDSRHFVEGSPFNKVWGVGLSFDDPRIVNPENWTGCNRLGKCHDKSRALFMRIPAVVDEADGA